MIFRAKKNWATMLQAVQKLSVKGKEASVFFFNTYPKNAVKNAIARTDNKASLRDSFAIGTVWPLGFLLQKYHP